MNDALEVVQALMCCACNNPDHHDAAAVLAAASGPCAEQLDTARQNQLDTERLEQRHVDQAALDDYVTGTTVYLRSRLTELEDLNKTVNSMYAVLRNEKERWRTRAKSGHALRAELVGRLTDLAAEMENPNTEHGTMPGVRMQVRREWAARLRGLLNG